MAYIRKRGNKWYFTIDVGSDSDGKRAQKSGGGFLSEQEAIDAAYATKQAILDGKPLPDKETKLADYSPKWLEKYSTKAKDSSVRIRSHHVKLLLKHFGPRQKLREISPVKYEKALAGLRKDGYATNTIAGVHGTAKMIFKSACRDGIILKNPSDGVELPREKIVLSEDDVDDYDELPKYMEKEELKRFLDVARDRGLPGDYAMFMTLAYTGIRVGELCALRWYNIHIEDNTIKITRTYYNPDNNIEKYTLLPPKTRAAKRYVDVDPMITAQLEVIQAAQDELKMRLRDTYYNKDFVFNAPTRPGYPAYVKLVENRMARLIKLAGLNDSLTPHSLRHTHTSLLAEAGVGLEAIMDRLGHCDDDTTRKIYLHVTRKMKKEASQKFSDLMGSLA